MDTPLCLTLSEVAHRSSLQRGPLDIFRILNVFQPCDWNVTVSFDSAGPRILFSMDPHVDPDAILRTTPIGLFDYHRISIGRGGKVYASTWREQLASAPQTNVLALSEVDSDGYPSCFLEISGRDSIPPELGEFDNLREFLLSNTWFGSKGIPSGRFQFKITTMGHQWQLTNRWQHADRALAIPTLQIDFPLGSPALGTMFVTRFADETQPRYRLSECGIVSESEIRALGWPVLQPSVPASEIEIKFPERTLGPDGTPARDSMLLEVLNYGATKVSGLPADPRYLAFDAENKLRSLRKSAQRIDRRKSELRHAQFVYWDGEVVYRCPTNENELVSLHQKLEGMGGVPFARFRSFEYTPKLGIDAIVDFKIDGTEPLKHLATVEFEYRLENYFNHDHPHEQTDLIVCWDGGDNVPVGQITRDPLRAWLRFLHSGHRIIPVAIVKDYPGIEIRPMEGGIQ